MATFGPIASPNPNILFNPMAVDQAVMAQQRNRLLMEQAIEGRQLAKMDREREEVGRVSASLLSLAPEARPQAYSAAVADLRRNGLAMQAPDEYPGDARVEQLARAAIPAAQQFQLAEKEQARQQLNALLGGIMGGVGGGVSSPGVSSAPAAPISGAGVGVPPTSPLMPRPSYAAGEEARSRLLDAPPEVLAQASAARSTVPELPGGYRAPEGVGGAYRGLPAPSGVINPNVGGSGGFSAAERAALGVATITNPASAPSLLMQMQAQRAAQAERATDNARADQQFSLQERRAQEQSARAEAFAQRQAEQDARRAAAQEQAMRLQAAASERQAETEERRARTAGLPQGWERDAQGQVRRIQGLPDATTAAPGKAQGEMLENVSSLRKVDETLDLLESTGGAGIGARGYLPQPILNRADPAGVKLRALIADIGSLKIHDRSGAAVTAAESPRLMPFIPLATDDPQTARTKLENFRNEYAATLRDQYSIYGPEAGFKPVAPVEQALGRAGAAGGQSAPQRLRFNPATGKIE